MKYAFDFGEEVRLNRDIYNDGTYPGESSGELLVARGSIGYVRDIGYFLQDEVIFSIHFLEQGRLVGCREKELLRSDEPWIENRFRLRDRVRLKLPLSIGDEEIAPEGYETRITQVIPESEQIFYHIRHHERLFRVAEEILEPA